MPQFSQTKASFIFEKRDESFTAGAFPIERKPKHFEGTADDLYGPQEIPK